MAVQQDCKDRGKGLWGCTPVLHFLPTRQRLFENKKITGVEFLMPTTEQKELLFYVSEHGQVAAATVRPGRGRYSAVPSGDTCCSHHCNSQLMPAPLLPKSMRQIKTISDNQNDRCSQLQLWLGSVGLKSPRPAGAVCYGPVHRMAWLCFGHIQGL